MDSIKIVFSTEDSAGTLVGAQLREKYGFCKEKTYQVEANGEKKELPAWRHESGLAEIIQISERLSRECEYVGTLPQVFASKLIIFASRHVSQSGEPCFTAHATGNFTAKTEFGGRPFELGLTSARASASVLRWLKSEEPNFAGYGVYREATHHGPTSLPWPSFFAELGSTQVQWMDQKAAAHLAGAIMHCVQNFGKENEFTQGTPAVGFGGTHYCSKFSSLEFEGRNCFSHVASKHVLDGIEKEPVAQALEKTVEKTTAGEVEVLLDWKGTNLAQREKLKQIFGQLGIEWKRA